MEGNELKMANTANTLFKLTTLDNTTLWSADTAELIDNLNQSVNVAYRKIERPRDDQQNWMSWGLNGRNISFQGVASYDEEVWRLSSAVNGKKLMKWWAGEDWYCYVLGQNCNMVRDQRMPSNASFTVGLNGVDPFWYYSNSTAGSGSGVDFVVPDACIQYDQPAGAGNVNAWATNDSYLFIDMDIAGSDRSTTYVEPVFWCIGGASTDVSQIVIDDQDGRKLTCKFKGGSGTSGAIGNTDQFVIMPYRLKSREGFFIHDASVIKLDDPAGDGVTSPSGTATVAAGSYAMDAWNLDSKYRWYDATDPFSCTLGQFTNQQKQIKNYPHCSVDTSFKVTSTGTNTDLSIYAQWTRRRL